MRARRRNNFGAVARAALALLGLGLVAGCSQTAPATPTADSSSSAASAQFLLSAAQAALRAGGAVHIDSRIAQENGAIIVGSADETVAGGRQSFAFRDHVYLTILVTGKVGYVKADLATMEGFFHVPKARAGEYWGEWISIRPGEKLGDFSYSDVIAGVGTLSSFTDIFAMRGKLTLVKPTVIDGQRVTGVQAPVPPASGVPAGARQTLYVTDDTLFRPVLFTWEKYGGVESWMSFSDWHERLRLTAPADAKPASQVAPTTT